MLEWIQFIVGAALILAGLVSQSMTMISSSLSERNFSPLNTISPASTSSSPSVSPMAAACIRLSTYLKR